MNLFSEGDSIQIIEDYCVEFDGEFYCIEDVTDFASFQVGIRKQLRGETEGKDLKITYKLGNKNMTVKSQENFQTAVKKMIQQADLKQTALEIEFKLTLCEKDQSKVNQEKFILDSQLQEQNSSWVFPSQNPQSFANWHKPSVLGFAFNDGESFYEESKQLVSQLESTHSYFGQAPAQCDCGQVLSEEPNEEGICQTEACYHKGSTYLWTCQSLNKFCQSKYCAECVWQNLGAKTEVACESRDQLRQNKICRKKQKTFCKLTECKKCKKQFWGLKAIEQHEKACIDPVLQIQIAPRPELSKREEAYKKVSSIFQNAPTSTKNQYIILLLGYTGQGKTTFLNFLFNAETVMKELQGITKCEEFNDPSKENDQQNKMTSKTSGVTQYQVKIGKANLIVVDTPGLGDTRGSQIDEKHIEEIKNHVLELGGANCIMIVQNGRESRLTDNLKYCFYQLCGIMPKQIQSQIMMVYTNCARSIDLSFDHEEFKKTLQLDKSVKFPYMYFENPFAYIKQAQLMTVEGKVKQKELLDDLMKLFYDSAEQLYSGFCELEKFERVPEDQFKKLYDKRNEVEAEIGKALLNYLQTDKKITDLEQIKRQLNQGKRDIKAVQDQIQKLCSKTELKIYTKATDYHNTNCNVCSVTCHYKCWLPFTVEGEKFEDCDINFNQYIGKTGICSQCQCKPNQHTHANYVFYRRMVETEFYKSLKKDLEEMQKGTFSVEDSKQQLYEEKQALKLQNGEIKQRIQQLIQEMSQYSMGPDLEKVKNQALIVFQKKLINGQFKTVEEKSLAEKEVKELMQTVKVIKRSNPERVLTPYKTQEKTIFEKVGNKIVEWYSAVFN